MRVCLRLAAVCALTAALSAGCGIAFSKTSNILRIGVLAPRTGAAAYYGEQQAAGIQLYADYLNKSGGIRSLGGARVELVFQDTAGDPEAGASAFELLVDQGVSAVIGPYNSTVASSTAPLAILRRVPYIVVNASSENFMGVPNKYVYRTNPGAGDGTELYAEFVRHLNKRTNGRIDTIALVRDSGDWGAAAAQAWSGLREDIGFRIAVDAVVTDSVQDFSALAYKIRDTQCDLVVTALFPNAAKNLTTQMYVRGVSVNILSLGGGMGDDRFVHDLGVMAENVFSVTPWHPDLGGSKPEALSWNKEFRDRMGTDMTMESAWGWLGMGTLAAAVEAAASTSRERISDALYSIELPSGHPALWFSLYDGVRFAVEGQEGPRFPGGVRYNNNTKFGPLSGLVIVQVQKGKRVPVFPLSMTGGEDRILCP